MGKTTIRERAFPKIIEQYNIGGKTAAYDRMTPFSTSANRFPSMHMQPPVPADKEILPCSGFDVKITLVSF